MPTRVTKSNCQRNWQHMCFSKPLRDLGKIAGQFEETTDGVVLQYRGTLSYDLSPLRQISVGANPVSRNRLEARYHSIRGHHLQSSSPIIGALSVS